MRMAILDGLLDDFDIEHTLYTAIRNKIDNIELKQLLRGETNKEQEVKLKEKVEKKLCNNRLRMMKGLDIVTLLPTFSSI